MQKTEKRQYSKGDQIHFIVTEDFVSIVNEFSVYCKKNSINASGAIRNAITVWLREKLIVEGKLEKLERGTSSLETFADAYEREVLREV